MFGQTQTTAYSNRKSFVILANQHLYNPMYYEVSPVRWEIWDY